MAIKQSKVTGRKLKEGEKADIFDSFDPFTTINTKQQPCIENQLF